MDALEELEQVSAWADESDAELVRCYGALAEVYAGEPRGKAYRRKFEKMLAGLAEEDDPLDELQVVIDQLRERGYFRAAWTAAQVAAEAAPDSSWAHSVAANCARVIGDHEAAARHDRVAATLLDEAGSADAAEAWMRGAESAAKRGAFADAEQALGRARALATTDEDRERLRLEALRLQAARDPEAAIREALALHAEVARDPHTLAETEHGFAVVELVLELLVAARDRRALAVQQTLVDAKLALWGECPSTWLERHNLGTVHAQLGERDLARALIAPALARLEAQFGPGHPHVEMARRSLARLDGE